MYKNKVRVRSCVPYAEVHSFTLSSSYGLRTQGLIFDGCGLNDYFRCIFKLPQQISLRMHDDFLDFLLIRRGGSKAQAVSILFANVALVLINTKEVKAFCLIWIKTFGSRTRLLQCENHSVSKKPLDVVYSLSSSPRMKIVPGSCSRIRHRNELTL